MDDTSMKKYIPAYGDRLAAVSFCKKLQKKTSTEPTSTVLDRLMTKLSSRRRKNQSDDSDSHSKSSKGNTNAQKKNRRVELGWLDYDEIDQSYKQVRSQKGGGTRQLVVGKNEGEDVILETGKMLFFPNGKSKKGTVDEFTFSVQDFRGCGMGTSTIAELYEETSVKILRLYVCTKHSHVNQPLSSEDSSCDDDSELRKSPNIYDSDGEVKLGKASNDKVFPLDDTLPCATSPSQAEISKEIVINLDSDTESVVEATRNEDYPVKVNDNPSKSVSSPSHTEPTQPEINTNDSFVESLPTTMPDGNCMNIRLHRIHIQREMIAIFKTPEIINMSIKVTFVDEAGEDAAGVSREAYSAFWVSFFSTSADGEDYRVPSLSPEYGLEEWQSVGRILAKGYLDHQVFPLQLAPAFFQALMFGEETVSTEDLCESFLLFLSDTDREVVKSALAGHLSDDDSEVFEDLLDREGCHAIPKMEQVRPVVMQMAHKCIVQNSNYALEAMRRVVQDSLVSAFPNVDSITSMYSNLKPTSKKICDLLAADPQTKEQSQALRFLMQFIRAQDNEGLGKVLRYLTASSIISVPRILVEFKDLSGLARRPVAHTCGPVLDLPSTYTSYREFRSEWQSILSSGYLRMDIM